MHTTQSELAGKIVRIRAGINTPNIPSTGAEYQVEDWWDRVAGKSWMHCDGNLAAMQYGIRSGFCDLPADDEVLYGKIGCLGHLIHISEIDST